MKKDEMQELKDLLALVELAETSEEPPEEYFTPGNQYETIGEGCYRRTPSQRDD